MTTTPTASPELPDLDKLEALARAATPGPWSLAKVVDRSIEHLCPVDRDRLSLLTVVHEGETPYGAVFRDEDAKFMAGIHPEQVLALIALARRAQPEGEAPQAVPAMWVQYIDGVKTQNVARDDKEKATVESIHRTMAPGTKMTWRALYDHAPAATLSPLCGAQHAESGKEAASEAHDELRRKFIASITAATSLGENAVWGLARQLLNDAVAALAAQQAAAPGNSPEIPDSSTSAPGTPEAPADDLYDKAVVLVRARGRASVSLVQRTFLIGYNRASRLLDAMEQAGVILPSDENGHRTVIAAQLDGGQEGSGS